MTSPAINYYRINATNTAIAQTNSGTGTPTEEIAAPLASAGTFSSYSTAGGVFTINGSGTAFNTFAVNQYLYYTDTTTGDYKLIGQISGIGSNTSLTITTAAVNNPTGTTPVLSASYALITNNESIYMRIATTQGLANGTWNIPNFGLGFWRQNNGLTGINIPAQSALQRVSNVGTPLSNATTVENIPFTFVTMNQFTVATTSGLVGTTYFPNTTSFPTYIWIRVTPQIGTSTSLSSQTLYRFTTQESMEALVIQQQTSGVTLQNAGYNNISTSGASSASGLVEGI